MNDEAKVLFDMFPDTPHQTLATIWRNCGEDFSTALDEALTVASLGNADEQARFDGGDFAAIEAPVDYWEDAPALLPALGERRFAPETSAGPVSSSRAHDTAPETRRPSANGGGVTYADAASAMSPRENGLPKLPWEGKEKRYVIGSGELGLLNELQMPRRGAVVPLPVDFLRVPVGSSQPSTPPAPAAEPLIVLDPDGRSSEPNQVPSPTLASVRGSVVWDGERGRGDPASSSPGASFGGRQFGSPAKNTPSVRASPTLLRNVGENQPTVESTDAKPQMKVVGGDRNGGERVGDSPGKEAWAIGSSGQRKKPVPTALRGEPIPANSRRTDSRPPARGGSAWGAGAGGNAQKVETASAAERIANFRPGTRFRVAVDKGVTGLGITVKEIRGRFFVYKLQHLADGSQGAAEEAGVKAGDQLLGVEELDFETERWDMDQLVSYMGELMGVVILHVMRGFGPLPQAPKSDFENGMSYGVARSNEEDGAADGSAGTDGGNESGASTVQRRARRLVEVLEEEDLSKPSEAADISRLYCQINDRARQWDTGELWLSVNDMARRPSRDTLAVMANQWHPDPPPGWDESDSSEGRSLPNSSGAQRAERSSSDISDDSLVPDPAATKRDGVGAQDGDEPGTDLDTIGAALLGQPLFSDPLMEGRVDEAGAAAAARSSLADGDDEGGGHYWSPWPQLVALESKAAQRTTVVPTQGLRKALNVRILEQPPPVPAAAAAGSDDGKGGRSSAPQTASYLVWVMDVESGAEWRVRRCHPEFSELWEVCTGMRPSLARLDFPPWLPDVKETAGVVDARRPRLEAYLQRLCSLLYMGPLHPSSAHLAHLLQDFLGTSPRVETLGRLQRSRPERELRQALQVRAWQMFRLPPLERAVADFVREICDSPASRSKKTVPAEAVLKRLTDVIEHLQYVVTEGCFNELREMVRSSSAVTTSAGRGHSSGRGSEGGEGGGNDHPELASLAEEDEALDLISGSVRRQVEAEVFVPVMGRIYKKLTEGATARLEKAVVLGVEEARGKPQTYHGVPTSNISPSGWSSSMRLLQTVGLFTLPCDKLDALMAVAHDIPALHRVEHPGDNASSLGADDFLPIFIYVLVNSRVENLAAQSVILETLCDPKKMMGEAGFCVATFSAALQHLSRQAEERSRSRTFSSFLGRR
ncbi:conserved unknown protein [Ectocarpus siliculosus]|uniref:VPS9 domain-containing protein n=1 Tax=Ectocarpus siliculosus TaxID=2880 RepID=D7G700_ECTSI|nr:conserved unknown protein [Ectocarpus siliculosus]|eukprot:CBJ25693.1 conserved unknown protein [Ectocarpus siliculosus]